MKNKKRIETTKELLQKSNVVWESHTTVDSCFLMGRAFFGDNDPRRFKLLQKYDIELPRFFIKDLDINALEQKYLLIKHTDSIHDR